MDSIGSGGTQSDRDSRFFCPIVQPFPFCSVCPFQIVVVESGEAIRLGDPQADSMKNCSSLRVRTGQMFGAEEVRAGTK